ncbi:MAG TPA: gephyrin-like molybdotransferase Glp [Thermoanaerobaculia bacterium]|nr:gephyrin-like molybdotransferase Glp [Thermoanaerobaculia bacterium]
MATTFQRPRSGEGMIEVEEAQRRVLAEVPVLGVEEVALVDALGRVLREDILAPADVPQRDNSAMDGYAVRAEDVATAPVSLRVIEDLPAGTVATKRVDAGMAIRIMTGALLPEGADAVVQVELTDAGSDVVRIDESVPRGANVRSRGEDMHAGDVVLRDGTPIRAGELGVLASVQQRVVRVGRRPEIAIFSTGDEVIDVDAPRALGKVVNSNAYALAALVREAGAPPRMLPIVPDRAQATIAAIESALTSDFVVSSGGVSAGAFDFVKDALDSLGAETKFWQVAMKPGKPVVLSRLRERLYFGLPGNPVSCMVSFLLFVAPSIRKAMGQQRAILPPVANVRLAAPIRTKGDRRTYFRVRVVAANGELVAHPAPAQGSGVLTSMIGANGLAILERGATRAQAGSVVPAVLIGPVASE